MADQQLGNHNVLRHPAVNNDVKRQRCHEQRSSVQRQQSVQQLASTPTTGPAPTQGAGPACASATPTTQTERTRLLTHERMTHDATSAAVGSEACATSAFSFMVVSSEERDLSSNGAHKQPAAAAQ
jgi:hypothetical protein